MMCKFASAPTPGMQATAYASRAKGTHATLMRSPIDFRPYSPRCGRGTAMNVRGSITMGGSTTLKDPLIASTPANDKPAVGDFSTAAGHGFEVSSMIPDSVSTALRGDGCSIHRNGLRFEKSGDSMAVFDGPYRIDRVTLDASTEGAFASAVDLWLFNRYMAEVA